MDVVHFLKQAKHQGLVMYKAARRSAFEAKWRALSAVTPAASAVHPYTYDPQRYRRSFLQRTTPLIDGASELPRRVFTLWTGENDLTPNRARSLEALRASLGVPVELVTPNNLADWIVEGHPVHPAYEHLSLVHRSDYLRAYLMHHHGGGYVDLKPPMGSWAPAFDRMDADTEAWLAAYGEVNAKASTRMAGTMGRDIAIHWKRLVGPGGMIARSHTPFTSEWLREVDRLMDFYAPQLAEFPGGIRGEVLGYPISWTHLLGRVYQPLQLKYLDHIRIDDSLAVTTDDYR